MGPSEVKFASSLFEFVGRLCCFIDRLYEFQVLVSIQGMILIPDPMYNEPGYEGMRNTPEGNVRVVSKCFVQQ